MLTPEDLEQIRQVVTTEVGAAVTASEERMLEAMRDMQTEMLRGLERFSRGNFAHFHRLDVADVTTNERLSALEERVLALETRPPRP
jgi:hypothetical protein